MRDEIERYTGEKRGWKSYPIRIASGVACHGQPMFLIGRPTGGWVGVKCDKCKKERLFRLREVKALDLWVACPVCNLKMIPKSLKTVGGKRGNHIFECLKCQRYIWLSDLLPRQ
jgi:hypothetical protein